MLIIIPRKLEIATWQSDSRAGVAWGKRVPLRTEVIAQQYMQITTSSILQVKSLSTKLYGSIFNCKIRGLSKSCKDVPFSVPETILCSLMSSSDLPLCPNFRIVHGGNDERLCLGEAGGLGKADGALR